MHAVCIAERVKVAAGLLEMVPGGESDCANQHRQRIGGLTGQVDTEGLGTASP